jgi:hypothetical protein
VIWLDTSLLFDTGESDDHDSIEPTRVVHSLTDQWTLSARPERSEVEGSPLSVMLFDFATDTGLHSSVKMYFYRH